MSLLLGQKVSSSNPLVTAQMAGLPSGTIGNTVTGVYTPVLANLKVILVTRLDLPSR